MKKLVALACLLLVVSSSYAALRVTTAPSFARPKSFATGRLPESVAIGDLNSDGKPDLATANQTGSISLLVNRGDGTFGRQTELRLAAAAVAIGDLNSDGKADL